VKVVPWLAIVSLASLVPGTGCGSKHASGIDETATLIAIAKRHGCVPGNVATGDVLTGAQFSCARSLGECGCRAALSIHTPDGSSKADVVQLVVANCRHEIAAPAAEELMRALFANPFGFEIDRPLHDHDPVTHADVDAPATALSVTRHYVDSNYPDQDVTIDWFNDVYSDGVHLAAKQRTETFKIIVSTPRVAGDRAMSWSEAATITSAPACTSHPPVGENMATIPAGPSIKVRLRCPPASDEATVPAFDIDRRLVSCADYETCIDARACRDEPNHCRAADTAVVTHESAAAYCKWRRARLPTLQEWQRAVRGDAANLYPTGATWDPVAGCRVPTWKGTVPPGYPRCENTSAAGVTYYVLDPNYYEWTGDEDCADPKDPTHREPMSMLLVERLDRALPSTPDADYGEFRCARGHEAK